MKAFSALCSESPVTLFRETVWRTQRRWRQIRLPARVGQKLCPVQYRPAGYYRPRSDGLAEGTKQGIIEYADQVVRGVFCCLGYPPTFLGVPPQWSLDFVSGKDWPLEFSESLKVVRHDGSDVKVPWELSRLQFLPVLGKAWWLTSNLQYRQTAKLLISDWIEKNPVGQGVNWVVAMEAALRAISLCLCFELLWPFSSQENPWLETATRSLWEHLLFIEAHNEFSHLMRSNHYLSNVAGLYCLSASLAGPGMKPRLIRYGQLLEREMQHQVNEDGGDYEASVGYHVLVTQLFTVSALLTKSGHTPSARFLDRLRKMYEYMVALADEQGKLPQFGDCDDGRAELLSDDIAQTSERNGQRNALMVSGLLGIGGFLFGHDFGGRDEDAYWHGADCRRSSFVPHGGVPATRVFPLTGVASVRRCKSQLLFLAMPNGIGGKGSHTHNDKLSVVLRVEGYDLFKDCGTFCYSRDAAKRNRFRSTLAHNTVRIDRQEQNRFSEQPGELFRMQNDAGVSRIEVRDLEDSTCVCAEHRGYQRLGVTHRRCALWRDASKAIIEDDLAGSGEHLIEAAWHLPKAWIAQYDRDRGNEISCTLQGPVSVYVKFSSAACLRIASSPTEISESYGAVSTGSVLTVSAKAELPFRLNTEISWVQA